VRAPHWSGAREERNKETVPENAARKEEWHEDRGRRKIPKQRRLLQFFGESRRRSEDHATFQRGRVQLPSPLRQVWRLGIDGERS